MSWLNNSFSPFTVGPSDVKIEFDEGVFFEVLDPDTGKPTYLKIQTLIGQETYDTPKEGDYVLREELIMPELKINKTAAFDLMLDESLWDTEIDLSNIGGSIEW